MFALKNVNTCQQSIITSFPFPFQFYVAMRSVGLELWVLSGMNSVSPSAVQYVGVVMQEELVESRRPQPLERQGSFGLRPAPTTEPGREANGEPDELDKLKSKLMTAWNNVKYGLYLVFEEECVGAALMFIGFWLRFLYVCMYIQYYTYSLLSLVKSVFYG